MLGTYDHSNIRFCHMIVSFICLTFVLPGLLFSNKHVASFLWESLLFLSQTFSAYSVTVCSNSFQADLNFLRVCFQFDIEQAVSQEERKIFPCQSCVWVAVLHVLLSLHRHFVQEIKEFFFKIHCTCCSGSVATMSLCSAQDIGFIPGCSIELRFSGGKMQETCSYIGAHCRT